MDRIQKLSWLRLIVFFALFAGMLQIFNQILIPIKEYDYYAFYDLSQRNDVELALVGNSLVQADFNPNIISEMTGLETFNVAVGGMTMPGALAATKVMYQSNRPKYVCLVLEPDSLDVPEEILFTQMTLQPFTVNPLISIPYYLNTCSRDGMYLERLFLFRFFDRKTWQDVRDTIAMRLDTETYFNRPEMLGSGYYKGRGYSRDLIDGTGLNTLRFVKLRQPIEDTALESGLNSYSVNRLLEYKKLCEKHGSQLIIVLAPSMLVYALSRDGYVQKGIELGEFCKENDIPFMNFYLARKEVVPHLDQYYRDSNHMDYRGADIFSEKFSKIFGEYAAGKDISQYFYETSEEFFASIDCITNTWIDEERGEKEDVYTADCLHGASVMPEYGYYLVEADGTEKMIQPYSENNTYRCPSGELAGKRLRVYARVQGGNEETTVYYDVIGHEQ